MDNATTLAICTADTSNRTPLPVMAFFPCNVADFRARGLTVAAQMAVERILEDPSILPEYLFQLRVNNTRVSILGEDAYGNFYVHVYYRT